jgi:large subunit ribosomal protein L29
MKASELRDRELPQLKLVLLDLLREQFNLRMQQGKNQLTRPSQMKAVRRDIARVRTIMHQKTQAAVTGDTT